jgi:hypothetical protein
MSITLVCAHYQKWGQKEIGIQLSDDDDGGKRMMSHYSHRTTAANSNMGHAQTNWNLFAGLSRERIAKFVIVTTSKTNCNNPNNEFCKSCNG